uniref:Uncharacterized protein n=1 Tax=Arundo donax TaxID=35708 RepID=A0A0A8ZEK7_ARUDO
MILSKIPYALPCFAVTESYTHVSIHDSCFSNENLSSFT